jgi:N-acyl-D-amino-acid deacylase
MILSPLMRYHFVSWLRLSSFFHLGCPIPLRVRIVAAVMTSMPSSLVRSVPVMRKRLLAQVEVQLISLLRLQPILALLFGQGCSFAAILHLPKILLELAIALGHLLLIELVTHLFLLEHKQQILLPVPFQAPCYLLLTSLHPRIHHSGWQSTKTDGVRLGDHCKLLHWSAVRSPDRFEPMRTDREPSLACGVIKTSFVFGVALLLIACVRRPQYGIVLRNGRVCDGTGAPCVPGGIAINGDTIAKVGDLEDARGQIDLDVHGQVIAPGFINMMSGESSLFIDGRSQSDIRQGVTLEIFGEGESMGPLNDAMRAEYEKQEVDFHYDVTWHTLAEGLETLARRGISTNIASFIGAATPRINVIGRANRAPTPAELDQMRELTAKAMEDGALGVASALIYQPGVYAKTDELIALAEVAARYRGIYISHMRNEGDREPEAIDELTTIARRAKIPAEIYHLKVSGEKNWANLPEIIRKIEDARSEGLKITADMYTYTAGATGLDASMPPWVQEGGLDAWRKRLQDPAIRKRVKREMRSSAEKWDNLYLATGSPDKVLLIAFKNEKLKPLTGKTLGEVARMRHTSPEDAAMDLVIEDNSRVGTVYFLMSEENIRRQIVLPWVSFASDADSMGTEGVFLKASAHPRAFGNFARVYARYVRDEKLMPLEEAVHKMTSLPASNLGIERRGLLREGYFADMVVFNPGTIQDHATFEKPMQYATGVSEVLVNGVEVIKAGEHTGAKPGRVVRRGR